MASEHLDALYGSNSIDDALALTSPDLHLQMNVASAAATCLIEHIAIGHLYADLVGASFPLRAHTSIDVAN